MRPPKRQWRDEDGVIHAMHSTQKLRYHRVVRFKCGRQTMNLQHATRDAPTCIGCVAYVSPAIYLGS